MNILVFYVGCLKEHEPTKYIRLAYLTGILPIKKREDAICTKQF